ncbi:P-loop containing nucleoside triphosphate hydrolase protein [Phialemonium atrogriseum]|uniref:ATP-dependent RNA helicase n=1 Tax=Phialemonium atrogriseum TaxID=1093897 RepID=A0AAJ0BV15_9PEZI|nr:P-loop containing nucleoside triphosphate hydrolase protein [Phialemonium atrogriseum]KAK1764776.1 P-loop containing nucleoside triphosphate hydrolase protein [Phialemonium atrogriseum]
MDILKILTRGIKQAPVKAGEKPASTNLPSAGNRTNPQFFHDDVGPRRGTKRKRNKDAPEAADAVDDSELDYFAPKKEPQAGGGENLAAGQKEQTTPEPSKRKIKLLDEDDCRQLLRSHRLKLTVLSGRAEKPAKVGKKRKKDKPVKAEGKDDKKQLQLYPQPLSSFSELQQVYGISPQVVENLTKQGFRVPTEVQMGSLPLLLRSETALGKSTEADGIDASAGVDFMAVAPTGSGKTVTFLIPAITGAIRRKGLQGSDVEDRQLSAIVVAPTRELASQIVNEGRKLAAGTGVRIYPMRKGLHITAEQLKDEQEGEASDKGESDGEASQAGSEDESDHHQEGKDGARTAPKRMVIPDILVTTPKSLLNLLSGGKSGANKALPSVTSLILDEADVLLDPLFQKQTLAIWKACTNPDLQLTFWSATMASNIETLITKQVNKRAAQLSLPARPLVRLVVGLKDTAVPNVTHKLIYTATEPGKLLALRQLLHPVSGADSGPPLRPPFLVFTQTIERAQALHDELRYDIPPEAGGAARIAVLHSGLSERARAAVMARFRAGDAWVLITTDVLARGVDLAGVNGVVSYDVPASAAAYVHRAGRTGRAGREGGVAVTFYTADDVPFVRSVANVIAASERQAGGAAGSGGGVQKWLLDALPKVAKGDKRRLKVRGVEVRRTGGGKAEISTKSAWEKRRENNKRGAIEGSKRRKKLELQQKSGGQEQAGSDSEWGGLDD